MELKDTEINNEGDFYWWETETHCIEIHADHREIAEALCMVEEEDIVHETPYGWWNQPIKYYVEHETIQVVDDTPLDEWQPDMNHLIKFAKKFPNKVKRYEL